MSGTHIRVDVLPIGSHEASKQYKVNAEAWVEAKEGEPYRIQLKNVGNKRVYCKLYLEGQLIKQRSVQPGHQATREYVTTNLVKQGRTHRQTRKQLIFSKPTMAEGDEDGTLGLAAQGQSELGCIRVDVYAIKSRKLSRHKGRPDVVVSEGKMNDKASSRADAKSKKGAFKSTSTIGGTKAVKAVKNYYYHTVRCGKKLESVYLRYGSVAVLLLMGVDKRHFMVHQNTQVGQTSAAVGKPEVVDLNADGDEAHGKCACGGRKSKRASEAQSRAYADTASDGEVETLSPPPPKRVKTELIAVD